MAKRLQKPVLNAEMRESARSMVEFGFWKHLEKFMEEMERDAMSRIDNVPLDEGMSDHVFCESRAIRRTIQKIRDEVEQYLL